MLVLAVPAVDKIYRMLNSTVGGWLLSLELRFAGRDVDLRKELVTVGLAVRLVQLKYNVCSVLRKNKVGVKSEKEGLGSLNKQIEIRLCLLIP